MKTLENLSASVRQRLLNRSRVDDRPFNEILQYYAMERFLYRLSLSRYSQYYILKGALLLRVWDSPEFRPTMDIDMLGKTANEEPNIIEQISEILAIGVEPDGLVFDSKTIRTERITENADYEGIRARFYGSLGTARISMQVDIGFGDIVYPASQKAVFPCMLDSPAPVILCYSRESVIAEKFEAMIKLGHLNSRMKDFYDIWLLSRQFPFDLENLAKAVELTFQQRRTELNQPIEAFSVDFVSSHQKMWAVFRKRLKQEHMPVSFADVIREIESFLAPVISAVMKR